MILPRLLIRFKSLWPFIYCVTQHLGELVLSFLNRELQPSCQLACLETVRILSRDKHCLDPFISHSAMSTLARYAGILTPAYSQSQPVESQGNSFHPPRFLHCFLSWCSCFVVSPLNLNYSIWIINCILNSAWVIQHVFCSANILTFIVIAGTMHFTLQVYFCFCFTLHLQWLCARCNKIKDGFVPLSVPGNSCRESACTLVGTWIQLT